VTLDWIYFAFKFSLVYLIRKRLTPQLKIGKGNEKLVHKRINLNNQFTRINKTSGKLHSVPDDLATNLYSFLIVCSNYYYLELQTILVPFLFLILLLF
jgi:hypothetical protein